MSRRTPSNASNPLTDMLAADVARERAELQARLRRRAVARRQARELEQARIRVAARAAVTEEAARRRRQVAAPSPEPPELPAPALSPQPTPRRRPRRGAALVALILLVATAVGSVAMAAMPSTAMRMPDVRAGVERSVETARTQLALERTQAAIDRLHLQTVAIAALQASFDEARRERAVQDATRSLDELLTALRTHAERPQPRPKPRPRPKPELVIDTSVFGR